jgi:hypothetical protein
MTTFGGVVGDVTAIEPEDMCAPDEAGMDAADAEELVRSVVGFMQDDESGLGAIYDLIGRRSTDPTLAR